MPPTFKDVPKSEGEWQDSIISGQFARETINNTGKYDICITSRMSRDDCSLSIVFFSSKVAIP